jgi:hypothetical protein
LNYPKSVGSSNAKSHKITRYHLAKAMSSRKIDWFQLCTQQIQSKTKTLTEDAQPVCDLRPVDARELDDGRSDGEDEIEPVPPVDSERLEVWRNHHDPDDDLDIKGERRGDVKVIWNIEMDNQPREIRGRGRRGGQDKFIRLT